MSLSVSKLIAVEGIEGSGKTEQIKRVTEELIKRGMTVKTLGFPRKTGPMSELIYSTLRGENSLNPQTLQILIAADFHDMQKEIKQWLRDFDIVMLDRYTTTNMAYSLAQGFNPVLFKGLHRDLIKAHDIMLDVHPNLGISRKKKSGIQSKFDEDVAMMEAVRRIMMEIVPITQRVIGDRPLEEITKDIITLIYQAPHKKRMIYRINSMCYNHSI